MKITARPKVYIGDGPAMPGTLTIEQDNQVLWSNLPRPNPSWSYTDRQGHEHAYVSVGERYTTPSLWVECEHVSCDGSCGDSGCEGYDIPHYFCRTCGEEITPDLLHGPHSFTVEGPRSWTVTVDAVIGQINDKVPVRVSTESASVSGTAVVVEQSRQYGVGGTSSGRTELVGVSELVESFRV